MPRKKLVINEEHVMSLRVVDLKKLCTKYKLAKRGRKVILQDRILEHLQLGKYAVTTEAEPTEEAGLLKPLSTAQSESEERKVLQKEQYESKVSLSVGSVNTIQLKPAVKLDGQPKSEQKLSSGETMPNTSEKGNVISEEVVVASSKIETKVEITGDLDVLSQETVENNENKTAGIKRTSSEASISDNDSTTEKKRKTAKKLAAENPEEVSSSAISKEISEVTGPEFEIEQKLGDSQSKVSSRNGMLSKIKTIPAETQDLADSEDTCEPEGNTVHKDANLEKKLDETLSKAEKREKKTEEVLVVPIQVDKTVSEATQKASGSSVENPGIVSKAINSEEADLQPSKHIESKNKIQVLTEMKESLPKKEQASSTQKEEKESKDKSVGDIGRLSKSRQDKKPEKKKETHSQKTYQQRRSQGRRDEKRNWKNRNRNRNTGYQPSYRQPRQSLFSPQGNWSSRINPRMANSMPLSQVGRSWTSQASWQDQRSSYNGGYGSDRRRSGRDRNWSRREGGGWQNRRNGRWRDNRSGRKERR